MLTLHRRAGQATQTIVADVRPAQWHAPTITDWDVRDTADTQTKLLGMLGRRRR